MNIVNITIKVASEEITISLDEAKKLYNELNALFGAVKAPNYDWSLPIQPVTAPTVIPTWYTTSSKEINNVNT